MALFRQVFTRSGNPPDLAALANTIRPTIADPFYLGLDLTAGVLTVVIEKPTAWSGGNITTVQNAVTAAPDATFRSTAQTQIDEMPILLQAICLAIIDQLNVIRGDLTGLGVNRPAITPAQAITAIRAKAGTL